MGAGAGLRFVRTAFSTRTARCLPDGYHPMFSLYRRHFHTSQLHLSAVGDQINTTAKIREKQTEEEEDPFVPRPLSAPAFSLRNRPPKLSPEEKLTRQKELFKNTSRYVRENLEPGMLDAQLPKFLDRPLGVPERPDPHRIETLEEARRKFISKERIQEERKIILKELSKGYYHDAARIIHVGAKDWVAPRTLIREDKALYFPDLTGYNLGNRKKTHTTDLATGKISLIALAATQVAEDHVKSFTSDVLNEFETNPKFRFIQVNVQENILKSIIVNLFISNYRKSVPAKHHASTILSTNNLEALREPTGYTNKHCGYVYLVDQNLKIRWAGSAFAMEEEVQGLRHCIAALLERQDTETRT